MCEILINNLSYFCPSGNGQDKAIKSKKEDELVHVEGYLATDFFFKAMHFSLIGCQL